MNSSTEHLEFLEWAKASMAVEPAVKRIRLIRALAEISGRSADTNELNSIASDLEAGERRFAEFRFQQRRDDAEKGSGR